MKYYAKYVIQGSNSPYLVHEPCVGGRVVSLRGNSGSGWNLVSHEYEIDLVVDHSSHKK